MRRHLVLSTVACACMTAATAHAFFEEGNDDAARLGYKKCSKWGDMTAANATGCNPWPDNDSAYTYQSPHDMKKNSVHYNATAALAVAAGFDRCAAYVIGLFDEGTDVATDYDKDLWIPFPGSVSPTGACAQLLAAEYVSVLASPLNGQLGGFVSPDFTSRSFTKTQGNEINRESDTFHFNHAQVDSGIRHQCSTGTDPGVVEPSQAGASGIFANMVTLPELRDWAFSSNDPSAWLNPLNSCDYSNGGGSILGPLSNYDASGSDGDPAPGSLGALGMFLHASQDYWSHYDCHDTSHSFGIWANDTCGFASGHYAGEFGTINGVPANGNTTLKTPVSKYRIVMHSANTVSALEETFAHLKDMLALHPEYARAGAVQCSDAQVHNFAIKFAGIANLVPASGKPSGAKQRSDLADALFASNTCSF